MTLYNRCMYAAFGEAVQKKGRFMIRRRLKSCGLAFADAKTKRSRFAILFADASLDSSTVVSWSIATKIQDAGVQTIVEFTPARRLDTPVSVSKLRKVTNEKPISKRIRRGQILCYTPSFIERIALRAKL